ncbi:hypothetical protein GF367_02210, partial [Candidatus Woesearchaeota archaeon]|nr:hypothetical protein [Candidatus Woesearchaeota archaeon]
ALDEAGFNRTAEPVEDAEEWASDNQDNVSENDTVALGAAFFVLKHNARPLLVSEPKVIVVDRPQTTVELYNPTTFDLDDLTYEFSEEIADELTIETKEEIGAYSYRRLKLTRLSATLKSGFGFLTVANLDDPVACIPVVITDTPLLNVTLPETLTVFGRNGELRGSAVSTDHTFLCRVSWTSDELSTPGKVRIKGKSFSIPITFAQALTKEDSYTGELSCAAAGKTITVPIAVYVDRYAALPLSVEPSDVVVNYTDRDVVFLLRNNLDRDLSVGVSLDRYGSYFGFRNAVSLSPNEVLNYTLTNNLPRDLNLTSTVLVQFEVFDRTEVASMLIDVRAEVVRPKRLFVSLLPLLVVLVFLGVVGYFGWKFRDVVFAELNKLNFWKVKVQKKQESKRIETLKESEQYQAITNMFNIMKFQNKDDKEIAQRLLASFSRDDIRAALDRAGLALPVLDEEEPEKA